jgi:rhodanese-related sulfurtransferase
MARLLEFAANNWLLVTAFVGVLIAVLVLELSRMRGAASSLEPAAATQIFNRQNGLFVDIRGDGDFRKGHLPGAVNLPASELDTRIAKLSRHKQRPLIVYCGTGLQSGKVAARLKQEGFQQVFQLRGGLTGWQGAGFPLETK